MGTRSFVRCAAPGFESNAGFESISRGTLNRTAAGSAAIVTRRDGRIEHDSAGIARAMAVRTILALREYGGEQLDIAAYGTEVDFCLELGFKQVPGVVLMRLAKGAKVDRAAVASAQTST